VHDVGEPLRVDATCVIDSDELEWRFEPAGGPGGQHANRAHTRAVVSFDVSGSPSLTAGQRQRIASKLGPVVRVASDDERSQARNRALAQERLLDRLASALYQPPRRRATRPSRSAVARRLDDKAKRSARKRDRARPAGDD
jgi:ribosome-associated protein